MTRLLFVLAIVAIIIGGVVLFSPQKKLAESEKNLIAATIFPIYDITKNIAGETLNVLQILPPGVSEHTFEPQPSAIRQLENAQVVYAVGHNGDDWVNQIIESVGAEKFIVDAGIEIRESQDGDDEENHKDEEEHGSGVTDPHYWLTIPNAVIIAQNITNDLSERFPEHAQTFSENFKKYHSALITADTQIRQELSEIQNNKLITLHDAWYYFADEYGLEIVGTFEPSAGREPTPQYLARLTASIETSGSTTLYSEPQLSISSLTSFAKDNGLAIAELDPIGGVKERLTYIQLMQYNAKTIAQNQ